MKTLKDIKLHIKLSEYRKNSQAVTSLLPFLGGHARLLDIGCADGSITARYAEQAGISPANTCGVEIDEAYLEKARQTIEVASVDMECGSLPFAEESFDVVVCNQLFEHIKDLRHLMAEIDKVTKEGGYLLVSVPNLAAWHNRLGLLFGRQPRCVKIRSAHIRGFCPSAIREFLVSGDRFKVVATRGTGFYPFTGIVSTFFSKIMPNHSVYQTILIQKTASGGWDFWCRLADL